MIVSLPPDTIRPSGYADEGGRYAMALMKVEPWEDIEQSYLAGLLERSFHSRTVASLEAERRKLGWGKRTPRTYRER